MVDCNLRTVLVLTLMLLAAVSGTLAVTQPPPVHACSTCNFVLTWGSPGPLNGEFNGPYGVAVDSSGNVYVTDLSNNRVEKFTATGRFITTWGSLGSGDGEFSSNAATSVAVDSSGNVYVTDYSNHRVEKFTDTGAYLSQLGCASGACPAGSSPGQFSAPASVAVDSSGNVYVTDRGNNRVEKFTGTGTYVTQWGCASPSSSYPSCPVGSGNGQFNGPYGVAVDSSGNVYVTDYSNNRVEKFTGTGTYVTQWGCVSPSATVPACPSGSGPGQFNNPVGVAVDASGNVYVTDQSNNRIEKFTSTGAYITAWGCANAGNGCSAGSSPGQFSYPAGVAVDASGNVYVTDRYNDRVELFSDATNWATIALVSGWNLISLPVVPLNTAIGKVLNDLIAANNITVVWSYQGGAWKSFTPPATGKLTTMQDGLGYWIYMSHPSTLTLFGYVFAPPPSTPPSYSLSLGWNLVGFKPQPDPTMSETVSTYLTSISGDYNTNNLWLYDNPTGTWIRATGSISIPVGEGLWVYMTTPATLRP